MALHHDPVGRVVGKSVRSAMADRRISHFFVFGKKAFRIGEIQGKEIQIPYEFFPAAMHPGGSLAEHGI